MRNILRSTVNLILITAMVITATVLLLAVYAPKADAKAVQIQAPVADYPVEARNPAIYVEQLDGPSRWYYAELADGSQWMLTRCRHEDSNNCWWNAKKRGNHRGHSFVVIAGVVHYLRTASQP